MKLKTKQQTNMNKTPDHQTLTNNIQTNLRLTKTLLNILWTNNDEEDMDITEDNNIDNNSNLNISTNQHPSHNSNNMHDNTHNNIDFIDVPPHLLTVAAPGLGIWGGIWGANSYFGGAR